MNNNTTRLETSRLQQGIELAGVEFSKQISHVDDRGWFREIFVSDECGVIKPEQWSLVSSGPNVLRGLHYHVRHDEYFSLVKGHCLLVLKDIRRDSPTYSRHSLYELFDSDPAYIAFPRGLIHGWFFYSQSLHLQAVSETYKSYCSDDNFGCHWNAYDLGFQWPPLNPKLSKRASEFGSVAELECAVYSGEHSFKPTSL